MEYLRNIGSAAVSALVQKSGINLPFVLGAKVTNYETLWTLYDATKRDDGSPVSVFEYDLVHPLNKSTIPLPSNAMRKLRAIRHPDILKFMDASESDSTIFFMTERVKPLQTALRAMAFHGQQQKEEWLMWGLHRISVALAFIHESTSSIHGNVCVNSIFVSPSGEWKLGGFEVLSSQKDDLAVIYTIGDHIPASMLCASPEVKRSGWLTLKDEPIHAADSYALGVLFHAVFSSPEPSLAAALVPLPPLQPLPRGVIPQSVLPSIRKLLNPNPKARMSPKTLLGIGMAEERGEYSGFFSNNQLVKVCGGLDNFSLSSEADKAAFLRMLQNSASSFPAEFLVFRVLPSLVSALEYGGVSAASIVPLILQFGHNVPPEDYSHTLLVPLIKLYANPDRGVRMALLDSLPEYAERLERKVVIDQVWPNLQTGFSDTVAAVREATVRAISHLSPNLSDRILNNDLLRHLAHLQNDPEASIRTNTCILIGRLGPTLGYNTKRKVLVPAFCRALKDPFVHARVAGLMGFMATSDCFDVEDIAGKVVPSITGTMLDKEKLVRDQAFKAVELFIKKLETHAANMPDTALTDTEGTNMPPLMGGALTQTRIVNSAAGAASALASWAIASIGGKLAPGDLQSTISNNPELAMHSSKGLQLNKTGTNSVAALVVEKASVQDREASWADDVLADSGWDDFGSLPPVVSPRPVKLTKRDTGVNLSLFSDEWGTVHAPSLGVDSQSRPESGARSKSPLEMRQRIGNPSASGPVPSHPSTTPSTPLSSPPHLADAGKGDSPKPVSKEEKAIEMARRKEERRLRIEKLKEQRRTAVTNDFLSAP